MINEVPVSAIWLLRGFVVLCVVAAAILTAQMTIAIAAGADWNVETPRDRSSATTGSVSSDFSFLERQTPFRMTRIVPVEELTDQVADGRADTPETRLDLLLHGFRIDGDARTSIAVISTAGGLQKDYRVGDDIEGVAEVFLVRIFGDGVIIERQGQNEWLALNPTNGGDRIVSVGTTGASTDLKVEAPRRQTGSDEAIETADTAETPEPAEVNVENKRTIVSRDELGILAQSVRFDPNIGDQETGFSVFPTRNIDLFRRAGFESGDVVTSVDGVDLENEADIREALDGLANTSEIRVLLVRGQRQINLVIAIQQ